MPSPDSAGGGEGIYVADPGALESVLARVRAAGWVAVDTEFVGEETYYPRLEVVQIASPGVVALVDLQAVPRPLALWDLLRDPRVLKVFHASGQDLPILARASGGSVLPVFDTQVAACLTGFGHQISYGGLVEKLADRRLGKGESFTDWTRRPLSSAQIRYAFDDVRYLGELHERLSQRLGEMGRTDWAEEEFRRLEREGGAPPPDDRERFRRVKGGERLGPREVAVLREMAAWREEEARRRNWPRPRVLADEALVGIAKNMPRTRDELLRVRYLPRPLFEHGADILLEAVRRGLQTSEDEARALCPARPARLPPGLLDFLQALLRLRAEALSLPPPVLATAAELERIAAAPESAESLDVPALSGWRRAAFGEELLAAVRGSRGLRYDPARRALRATGDA